MWWKSSKTIEIEVIDEIEVIEDVEIVTNEIRRPRRPPRLR